MKKVFLINGINGNILVGGIVHNGKLLKYSYNGNYIGEFPVPFNPDAIREIDLISILNVNNQIEIAYVVENTFNKTNTKLTIEGLIQGLSVLKKGNVFVGRREGAVEGINYTQYFYGYIKGQLGRTDLVGVLGLNV